MLRPILAALILTTALPAAAETDTLHYNMIEFAESANLEITRDTMTAYFSIASEGKDRATVNKAFQKKFNDFNKAVQNNKLQTEILNRSASPRYEYNNNGKRIQTGWEEEAVFKVESKDFDAINRLIDETLQTATLNRIGFSISKENAKPPSIKSAKPPSCASKTARKIWQNARLLQLQNRQTQFRPHRQPLHRQRLRPRQNDEYRSCHVQAFGKRRKQRYPSPFSRLRRNQHHSQRLGADVKRS